MNEELMMFAEEVRKAANGILCERNPEKALERAEALVRRAGTVYLQEKMKGEQSGGEWNLSELPPPQGLGAEDDPESPGYVE